MNVSNDLTKSTFQNILRVIVLITLLICLNIYLGSQSETILCQTTRQCSEKNDHLIRLAYNIMTMLLVLGTKIDNYKQLSVLSFVSIIIACLIISFNFGTSVNS